jgi:hypothetical protein
MKTTNAVEIDAVEHTLVGMRLQSFCEIFVPRMSGKVKKSRRDELALGW